MAATLNIQEAIKAFVAEKGWKIATTQKDGTIVLLFGDKDDNERNVWVTFHGREQQRDIRVRCAQCKMVENVKDRDRVLEFLARANWGLNIGSFKIDMNDGETFFEAAADIKFCDAEDVNMLLTTLTSIVRSTMDKYQRGIIAMMNDSSLEPSSVISIVEGR
eukprot:TRINITY_DN982_c0_g1_i3.p1 TRINITY_DN982_c0_g1~~TRINITY_DN982_c0_g1_i3.p1  ORF type:complete len:174 (-),score=48.67 TRINITY_DN982_c0_g1_i3:107-592(-)